MRNGGECICAKPDAYARILALLKNQRDLRCVGVNPWPQRRFVLGLLKVTAVSAVRLFTTCSQHQTT